MSFQNENKIDGKNFQVFWFEMYFHSFERVCVQQKKQKLHFISFPDNVFKLLFFVNQANTFSAIYVSRKTIISCLIGPKYGQTAKSAVLFTFYSNI